MSTTLNGKSLIGFNKGTEGGSTFNAINPASGEALEPNYHSAKSDEVEAACELAKNASKEYSKKSGKEKAVFLRAIADNIQAIIEDLVQRTPQESALPEGRIRMETGRTCGQLRMFADHVEEGSWVGARIEHGIPDRQPLPKPDLRSMCRPLGPVAVFGASNFPLAFSTAGGDTAAALASGCPVIVNAHYAHPGTAELVGEAILKAVQECGMPEGTFSLLFDSGHDVGQTLVNNPNIKAVGFTGSQKGGRAIMDLAAARSEPIPVYAEMSSINPVFILPGAMAERGEQLATGLHGSVNLGAGQFCTNPGLVIVNDDEATTSFVSQVSNLMSETAPATMLTPGINSAYASATSTQQKQSGVETIVGSSAGESSGAIASLQKTSAENFLSNSELADEVFGPSTLIVTQNGREEILALAESFEGQLTATIHGTEEDLLAYSDLISILENKVGRLIFNSFPTGVEVCHSMVHGGPYPATSDGRSTSVGSLAIHRFTRLISYQGWPDAALPDELKESNPCGITRMIDGKI